MWHVKNVLSIFHGKVRMLNALKGKDALPAKPANEEKEYLLEPTHSTIKLSLVNEVLREKIRLQRRRLL